MALTTTNILASTVASDGCSLVVFTRSGCFVLAQMVTAHHRD